jgi:hypothetical protein
VDAISEKGRVQSLASRAEGDISRVCPKAAAARLLWVGIPHRGESGIALLVGQVFAKDRRAGAGGRDERRIGSQIDA